MPPFRAVAATVLPAAVLWVGLGAVGAVVSYFGTVPSPIAALLLPATLPRGLWFGAPSAAVMTALLGGAVYAAVLALLLLLVQRREARAVVRWARALGLRNKVLPWEGDKPSTGIQEAAREERYRLLAEFARRAKASRHAAT